MKVALYARTSCSRGENNLSIQGQLRELHKYAKQRDWEIYGEFVDKSISARSDKRPAFREMIECSESREFSAVLIWKFSRFSRNQQDSKLYKSLLQKHDVQVISINESRDCPSDKLLENIIEVFDEYYSNSVSQDTRLALRQKKLRRPPLGYIYDSQDRSRWQPDPQYASVIQQIFELCINGNGAINISKNLHERGITTRNGNMWSSTTIFNILRNEAYIDGLITHDIFLQAQQAITARSPKISHNRATYLLRGFIYCGKCGSRMVGKAKSPRLSYYCCCRYRQYGKHACSQKQVNRDTVENTVMTQSFATLEQRSPKKLRNYIDQEVAVVIEQLQQQIHDLQRRLDQHYEAFELQKIAIEFLAPRMEELFRKIQNLQQQHRLLVEAQKQKDFYEIWKNISGSNKTRWLRHFIEKVECIDWEIILRYWN